MLQAGVDEVPLTLIVTGVSLLLLKVKSVWLREREALLVPPELPLELEAFPEKEHRTVQVWLLPPASEAVMVAVPFLPPGETVPL